MSETPRLKFNPISHECEIEVVESTMRSRVGDVILLSPDVEDVWDDEAPRLQIHVYKNDEYLESTHIHECEHVDADERWMFVERIVKKYAEEYSRRL